VTQRNKRKKTVLDTSQVLSFLSNYGFKTIFANKSDSLFAQTTIEVILNEIKAGLGKSA
jgi:uncharacterized protein YggL (DUF469 family)